MQNFFKKNGFTPINSSGEECNIFGNKIDNDIDIISQNEWVWSAISAKTESFSKGELKLYKRTKEGKEEIKNHKALDIFRYPNPIQSQYEMTKMVGLHLCIYGEAILQYDELLKEIIPIIPSSIIEIKKDIRGLPSVYVYSSGGSTELVDVKKIIHIKDTHPSNYVRGFSSFQTYKETAVSDNYANKWNRKGFDGTRVEWVMKHVQTLENGVKRSVQAGWRKLFNWRKRKSDIAILDGGMDLQKISNTPKDMDFVELGKNAKDRILAANRVPKALIGQAEDFNKANIWGIEYIFESKTIAPMQLSYTDKLNHSFLKTWFPKEDIFFEIKGNIPQDTESRLLEQKAQFSMGAITPNEIREEEGKEPLNGGDDAYIPFSVLPLGEERNPVPVEAPKKETEKKTITSFRKKSLITSFQSRMKKNDKILNNQLVKIFKEQEKIVLKNVKKSISKDIQDPFDVVAWSTVFQKTLYPTLLSISQLEGQASLDEMGIQFEFQKEDPRLTSAIESQTFKFSNEVNKTTLDALQKTLLEGTIEGESEDEISKRVKKVFKTATTSRSRMIASTEVHKSMNIAHHVGYQQTGVEEREWISLKRIREDHIEVSGITKGINEPFLVGGEYLMYPGDPSGSPANTILCGCRTIPVI